MNPASPIQSVNVLRVPQKQGEQKRKDARTAEDFRRALQQEQGETPPDRQSNPEAAADGQAPRAAQKTPSARHPMPRGLQPARPFDRREVEPGLCHVDVIA